MSETLAESATRNNSGKILCAVDSGWIHEFVLSNEPTVQKLTLHPW